MAETALHWDVQGLREQLSPLLPGLVVEVVARLESTNSALLQRASKGVDIAEDGGPARVRRSVESAAFGRRGSDLQPCLLVAEHQTHGRGRQGRDWQATPAASLTFSLALPLAPQNWSGLSLAVGVALADALDPHAEPPRIGVKWPNDLWLLDAAAPLSGVGRKLGGVLIETVAAGVRRLVVVGVGLNVLPMTPTHASSGFACLSELDAQASAPQALARIARPLVEALQLFDARGFAAFAERFAARDLLRGHTVHTTREDAAEGVAVGVAASGELLLRTPHGVVPISSGEVSVRLSATSESSC